MDECVDWRLSRDIVGHEVKTAHQMGWAAIKNGELLALASQHFDVFVTVDRIADLRTLVPQLLKAIETARRGLVEWVDA